MQGSARLGQRVAFARGVLGPVGGGREAHVAMELTREVAVVVEARFERDCGDRHAAARQQAASRDQGLSQL